MIFKLGKRLEQKETELEEPKEALWVRWHLRYPSSLWNTQVLH